MTRNPHPDDWDEYLVIAEARLQEVLRGEAEMHALDSEEMREFERQVEAKERRCPEGCWRTGPERDGCNCAYPEQHPSRPVQSPGGADDRP